MTDIAPADSHIGAAAWKKSYRPMPVSSDPLVVFAAPLMSRAFADDWGTVSRTVARAVASLRAQTDPNWRLLICSWKASTRNPRSNTSAMPCPTICKGTAISLRLTRTM